jgi:hypothetical protein
MEILMMHLVPFAVQVIWGVAAIAAIAYGLVAQSVPYAVGGLIAACIWLLVPLERPSPRK